MSAVIPLLPLNAFMVWRRLFYLIFETMQFVHNPTIITSLKPSGYYMYHQVYNLKILHCVQTIHLCVWYGTQNKKQLFPYIVLTGRFNQEHGAFRLSFLFQGLNKRKQNMLLNIKQSVYSVKNIKN